MQNEIKPAKIFEKLGSTVVHGKIRSKASCAFVYRHTNPLEWQKI